MFVQYWYIAASIYAAAVLVVFFLYKPPTRELQKLLTVKEKLRRVRPPDCFTPQNADLQLAGLGGLHFARRWSYTVCYWTVLRRKPL